MNGFEIGIALKRRLYRIFGLGYLNFGCKSVIYKPLYIKGKKYIRVGKHSTIFPNARIEAIDKWNKKKYNPLIEIGDKVAIGQNLHLTCANSVVIGNKTIMSAGVLITDIDHMKKIGENTLDCGINVGKVNIGRNVLIGANAVILGKKSICIGDDAVIGANAVVTNDVPAGTIVAGAPAKIIRYI